MTVLRRAQGLFSFFPRVVSCVSPKIHHQFASLVVQFADSNNLTDSADDFRIFVVDFFLTGSGP